MASQPVSRLTKAGILTVRQGALAMSDGFTAHLSSHRHSGAVPSWDLLAVLERAVASWSEYAGDARESARTLVRFLPAGSVGSVQSMPAFPVLDAFIAA